MPDVAIDAVGNFVVAWNNVNGSSNEIFARWFSAAGVGTTTFRVNTNISGAQDSPSVAMNRNGEFAIVWKGETKKVADVYGKRYDRLRRPIGDEFRLNTETLGSQSLPDVAIDENGNLIVVWTDTGGASGDGISARWFDQSGNLLADEFRVVTSANVGGRSATVNTTPAGEFVVSWSTPKGTGSEIRTQRFTLRPPIAQSAKIGSGGNSLVISFSQKMATTGVGSISEPANWALQLADGRYLAQKDADISGDDPRATTEQFDLVDKKFQATQVFNAVTGQWDVTLPVNFILSAGNYKLIARGSLQDAAGRALASSTGTEFPLIVVAPKGDIVDVAPKVRTSPAGTVTLQFDQDVIGVDIKDFTLTRNGDAIDLTGSSVTRVSSRKFTINLTTLTARSGEYVLTLAADGSGIQGLSGNVLSTNIQDSFVVDQTLVSAPTYSSSVSSYGPVGYWRLSESTGTAASDSSGNKRNGVYRNGVSLGQRGALSGPSSSNNAASFDGINDHVSIPDSTALRSSQLSLEALVKINSAAIQDDDAILMKTTTKSRTDGYGLYYSKGYLHFFVNHFSNIRVAAPIIPNQFVHVVATYDGKALRLYFNGILVSGKTVSVAVKHSVAPLLIGAAPGGSNFGGTLDEISIYNRALSAVEVGLHYKATVPETRTYSSLIVSDLPAGYWRLNETSGVTTRDASGFARNGTYQNSPRLRERGALSGSGESDFAVGFDSAIDQVRVPDSLALRNTRLSLEVIVKIDSSIQDFDAVLMKTTSKAWSDGYGVYYQSGQLHFFLNDFSKNRISASVPRDQFVHVVSSYDGAGMRMYFNGVLVASKSFAGSITQSLSPLLIGAAPGGRNFGGVLDEVVVYGRALNSEEVQEHFNATSPKNITYNQQVISDLPAGYWRLNDLSGTVVNDSSGNNLQGSYIGGIKLARESAVPSRLSIEASVGFDGQTGRVSIPDSVALRGTRLSLEAFIKLNSATIQNLDSVMMKTSSKNRTDGYGIYYQSGQLHFFVNNSSTNRISAAVPLDQFVHVSATFDGASMSLYLNGIAVAKKAFTGAIVHSTTPLLLGAATGGFMFGGVLDEVAVYRRALTPAEVLEHFRTSIPESQSYSQRILNELPAGYWRLDESSGTVAADRSGNKLHGVIKKGTTLAQAGGLKGAETSNTAIKFDGTSGQITVADAASLRSTRLTLEVMVKIDSAKIQDFDSVLMKTTSASRSDGYGIYYQAGKLHFFLNNYSSNRVSASVTANRFVHVAATFDGTSMRLYLDGVLAASRSFSGAIIHSKAQLSFGAAADRFNFGGSLDEVSIFGRALSLLEIQEHYRLASK